MAQVARQDRQTVASGCSRDGDIGKARGMTRRPCLICQFPRQPGRSNIKRQHATAVEMEHKLEPVPNGGSLGGRPGPFQLGHPVAISATVTTDRKSILECVSIQSINVVDRFTRPGAPTDSTLVSTKYKSRS